MAPNPLISFTDPGWSDDESKFINRQCLFVFGLIGMVVLVLLIVGGGFLDVDGLIYEVGNWRGVSNFLSTCIWCLNDNAMLIHPDSTGVI